MLPGAPVSSCELRKYSEAANSANLPLISTCQRSKGLIFPNVCWCLLYSSSVSALQPPPTSQNCIIEGFPLSAFVSRGEDCCCWEAEDFVDRPAAATGRAMIGWLGDDVCDQPVFAPAKSSDCWVVYLIYFVCGWLIVSNREVADALLSYAFKRAKSCHFSEAFETAQGQKELQRP